MRVLTVISLLAAAACPSVSAWTFSIYNTTTTGISTCASLNSSIAVQATGIFPAAIPQTLDQPVACLNVGSSSYSLACGSTENNATMSFNFRFYPQANNCPNPSNTSYWALSADPSTTSTCYESTVNGATFSSQDLPTPMDLLVQVDCSTNAPTAATPTNTPPPTNPPTNPPQPKGTAATLGAVTAGVVALVSTVAANMCN